VRLSELVQLNPETIFRHFFNLNMLAPAMLTNAFISRYEIVNRLKLSQYQLGAAHKPLKVGQATAAQKAGLANVHWLSAKENEETGIRFFSLASGIIDTECKLRIRESAKAEDFQQLNRFKM